MLTIALIAQLTAASCASLESTAARAMEHRQGGTSPSELMAAIPENSPNEVRGILEALIIEAYDQPRFSTKELQNRAVQDFSAYAYITCMKAVD